MIRGPKGTEHRRIRDIICSEEYAQYIKEHPKEKINIQQVAKAAPVLEVLSAGDGYFVEQDITSLEPTVLAELSGNETYKEIYASGKPHDVYLFTAIKIMPWAGEEINKVYNISSPTKESVAEAKKRFKKERTQAKPVFLCLAPNTPVLTSRGWKLIQDVTDRDLVYNGTKWVKCNGAQPTAIKEVLNKNGLTATRDHKVLTTKGWEVHERAEASQYVIPEKPRFTWTSLWKLVCSWISYKKKGIRILPM